MGRLAEERVGLRWESRETDERDRSLVKRREEGLGHLWCNVSQSIRWDEAGTGSMIQGATACLNFTEGAP